MSELSSDHADAKERIAELERENAALRRDAERWRECERLAESQLHKRERLWTTRFVPGDTFAAAIDAEIQKRKETT